MKSKGAKKKGFRLATGEELMARVEGRSITTDDYTNAQIKAFASEFVTCELPPEANVALQYLSVRYKRAKRSLVRDAVRAMIEKEAKRDRRLREIMVAVQVDWMERWQAKATGRARRVKVYNYAKERSSDRTIHLWPKGIEPFQ